MPGVLMPVKGAARAGGRFRRKAEDAAVGAAMGAGRGFRYVRDNAMPLTLGATVGGGAATAYQQSRARRKVEKGYVTVSRNATEGMQRLARRSNAIQAMKESADPAVAARGRLLDRRMTAGMKRRAGVQSGQVAPRVSKGLPSALKGTRVILSGGNTADGYAVGRLKANAAGRGAAKKKSAGDSVTATGLMSVGRENRQLSRYASASGQRRRGMLSPRRAEELSLNSYRNPLSRV